jgi:choline dehydrogenase
MADTKCRQDSLQIGVTVTTICLPFFLSLTLDRNIDVSLSLGVPHVHEANNPTAPVVACTHLDATINSNGKRSATSDAFLPKKLIQSRKNLDICTGTLVSGLEIHHQKVVGVYLESDSGNSPERFRVAADREVILCAGAIATPQILLLRHGFYPHLAPLPQTYRYPHLSGIGPADHLRQHGIPIVKDLPGVGGHLVSKPCFTSLMITHS